VSRVKMCIKHGIYSPLAVMMGMPGETINTARDTGRLIGEIASELDTHPKLMGYDIFYALPLPGTPLYEYGEKLGIIDPSPLGTGQYLERVTDAGTYKRYYVNLNGAPTHEVIFWDVLVALEASRTFRNLQLIKYGKQNLAAIETKAAEAMRLKREANPRYALKYTALKFTFITYFIDNYIIGSRIVDLLPSWLVYPLVRFINYSEFILQSIVPSNKNNNIFVMKGLVPRLDFNKFEHHKNPKKKSLRAVCMDLAYPPSCHPSTASSKYRKSRELLVRGL